MPRILISFPEPPSDRAIMTAAIGSVIHRLSALIQRPSQIGVQKAIGAPPAISSIHTMVDPVQQAKEYLESVLPDLNDGKHAERPHITLTYAQSLDAKIAGRGGLQINISCYESFIMTHWMRTMHDGIMIGIGTAINDNPGLAPSKLPPRDTPWPAPTPMVLDTHYRLPLDAKMIKQHAAGKGKQPWVIGGEGLEPDRRAALENAGAKVVEVKTDPETGRLDLLAMLAKLKELGVRSVMVEGGRQVISEFLTTGVDHKVVDKIIWTVAPMLVGYDGLPAALEDRPPPKLTHVKTEVMGIDSIITCTAESQLAKA